MWCILPVKQSDKDFYVISWICGYMAEVVHTSGAIQRFWKARVTVDMSPVRGRYVIDKLSSDID